MLTYMVMPTDMPDMSEHVVARVRSIFCSVLTTQGAKLPTDPHCRKHPCVDPVAARTSRVPARIMHTPLLAPSPTPTGQDFQVTCVPQGQASYLSLRHTGYLKVLRYGALTHSFCAHLPPHR